MQQSQSGVPMVPMPRSRMYGSAFNSESLEFMKSLIEEDVPEKLKDLKNKFWGFLSKESALTFLKMDDFDWISNRFEIARLYHLMGYPKRVEMETLKAKMFIKARRSLDGFERKQQTTQIQEHRIQQTIEGGKPSFLGRIFGK